MRERIINRLVELRRDLVSCEVEWEYKGHKNDYNRLIYASKIACLKTIIEELQKLLEP
jgi:hypothetical protein